jgi:hypothetical protein
MENSQNASRELARAFNKVVAAAPDLAPEDITRRLDDIAAEFRGRVTSEVDRLETKRRVAEWKFKLLSERDLPLSQIESLHTELELLGYTNVEVEATIEIYFAQYLVRNSHKDMARARLDGLLKKLVAASSAGDRYAGSELIADAQRLRSRLDS